ncbi:uncharacterized protein (DUF2147 family) [Bradyrhizobium sp. LM4.3]
MRLALYTGLILAGGFTCLTPALAADPTGDWRVADAVANIRVAQCNGSMWGAVSWEKEPGGRDEYNPDASKKTRPTLGMATLIDMKKKPGADQWEGQVYNAKDGQLYSATITPVGTDQLEIKGCVMGFLCGGETWTRVGPPIPLSTANAMAKGAPKSTPARCRRPRERRALQRRSLRRQPRRPPALPNLVRRAPPTRSATSAYSLRLRGLPISAG